MANQSFVLYELGFSTFLLLWPWNWLCNLPIRTWHVFPGDLTGFADMNFLRQGFWKLLSDRQTDRQTDWNCIPRGFAVGQLNIRLNDTGDMVVWRRLSVSCVKWSRRQSNARPVTGLSTLDDALSSWLSMLPTSMLL